MRKTIVFCLMLLTLFSAGCDRETEEITPTPVPTPAPLYFTEDDSVEQPWGLQLDVERVTADGAEIICTRYGSDVTAVITTGTAYQLSKWTADGWVPAEGLIHVMDIDWGTYRRTLREGDSITWSVDWTGLYEDLSLGSYRLSKQFRYYGADGVEHVSDVYVQFDVTEETIANAELDNRWGIGMTADNVTPDGLTLTITRMEASDWEVITGADYRLEVLTAGTWTPYERSDGLMIDFAWESIGYLLSADAPLTLNVDWTWLHGTLPAGRYRLVKEFIASLPSDRDPPHDRFDVSVEFEIP